MGMQAGGWGSCLGEGQETEPRGGKGGVDWRDRLWVLSLSLCVSLLATSGSILTLAMCKACVTSWLHYWSFWMMVSVFSVPLRLEVQCPSSYRGGVFISRCPTPSQVSASHWFVWTWMRTKKNPSLDSFTGEFYWTLKEELILIFPKHFQKIE